MTLKRNEIIGNTYTQSEGDAIVQIKQSNQPGRLDVVCQRQASDFAAADFDLRLDSIKFKCADEEEFFKHAITTIDQFAKPNWIKRPLQGNVNDYELMAIWRNGTATRGKFTPSDQQFHRITAKISRVKSTFDEVANARITSEWYPSNTGWGARVEMETSPTHPAKTWSIDFTYADRSHVFFKLLPSGRDYHRHWPLGGTSYEISIATPNQYRISDKEILAIVKSPESVRDYALASLDQFRKRVIERVESGDAVKSAFLLTTQPARQSAKPASLRVAPRLALFLPQPDDYHDPPPQPSNRKLTVEEKKQIISDASEMIDHQELKVRENYKEMHTAIAKCMPIKTFLQKN